MCILAYSVSWPIAAEERAPLGPRSTCHRCAVGMMEAIARVPLRASARRPSLAAEWRDNGIPSHGNVRGIDEARVRLRRVLELAEHDRYQSGNADPGVGIEIGRASL
jgi:hypothetical protein